MVQKVQNALSWLNVLIALCALIGGGVWAITNVNSQTSNQTVHTAEKVDSITEDIGEIKTDVSEMREEVKDNIAVLEQRLTDVCVKQGRIEERVDRLLEVR